jgi:hypothetical protein
MGSLGLTANSVHFILFLQEERILFKKHLTKKVWARLILREEILPGGIDLKSKLTLEDWRKN